MTVLNFKGFNFKIILNLFHTTDWKRDMAMVDFMGDPCITLCTPWGPTRLWAGIQYVTPVLINIYDKDQVWLSN